MKPCGSTSSWNILLAHRLQPNRQTLILCILWFLSNRQPFLLIIIFLDTCQKMVSTHAPQFRNNLFVAPKLFQIMINPLHQRSNQHSEQLLVPRAHGTLKPDEQKLFFAPGSSFFIHIIWMRRSIFCLFTQSLLFTRPINNTLWPSISIKLASATALSALLPPSSWKTLTSFVAMAGSKRSGEGPSNDPPSIRCRSE